jgi:hypothetical protein
MDSMKSLETAIPGNSSRGFVWSWIFQTIPRALLTGNAVSKQLVAFFYLETDFPNNSSRSFTWKRRYKTIGRALLPGNGFSR